MRAWYASVVLACAGCGGGPLLADITPASAELINDKRADFGIVGSIGLGGGTLVIVDTSGATFHVPVSTHGVGLGALLEMSASQGNLAIDLTSSDVARATDLFGHYEGSRAEIVITIGASYLELQSELHATMSGWLIGGGTALWAGHQWIFLEPAGDPIEVTASP